MDQFRMRLHLEQLDWPDAEHPHKYSEFEMVTNQAFSGERILVDNRHFQDCKFERCRFVHSGGPFAFYECEILDHAIFSPTGAASRTMRLYEAVKPVFGKGLPPI
jgi:hypothetical protein